MTDVDRNCIQAVLDQRARTSQLCSYSEVHIRWPIERFDKPKDKSMHIHSHMHRHTQAKAGQGQELHLGI